MSFKDEVNKMLPPLEQALKEQVAQLDAPRTREFHRMLVYHMGWTRGTSGRRRAGKRIRPLILLLSSASIGGRWRAAIPAAAALEIAHNFSLIHDDIQDNSPTRRGRPALWTKYGVALAINAGDALFAMAGQAVLNLGKSFKADTVVRVAKIFETTCLELTRGQFLDLFHKDNPPTIADYWPMVEGKTAALLSAGTQMGALLGGANQAVAERYRIFGQRLGVAFQIQDDILGIWGDEVVTGKSAAGDLVEGKLSLPVLYGISRRGGFAKRWAGPKIRPGETAVLRQVLKDEGAYDFAAQHCRRLTKSAMDSLHSLKPQGSAGAALMELTEQLLGRAY